MRLQNKTAVVTGAASGFGAEIARAYAREGANVVIADINDEWGKSVATEIDGINAGRGTYIHADVSRFEDVEGMVQAAVDAYGRVDIIVNNAGYTHRNMPVLDVPEEEYDRIFDVNVKSIFHAVRAAAPRFLEQEKIGPSRGVIINVASTAAVRPRTGLVWYNASKSAAVGATRSLAVEFGPQHIRVAGINPVAGETPLLEKFMGEDTPEKRAAFKATVPLGRFSQPSDIANAAVFLAADESEFLTGICIDVDGGRCV